jgi:hypothetical protein
MTKQNRNTLSLGPAGTAALFLLLAASPALAISAVGDGRPNPGQRERAMRVSLIRLMDIFAQDYGSADFSPVVTDLESHMADPANPAFMSVPLSLANVYLNRYEVGWNKADLERSIEIFEWVVARRDLWGGRDGTGSVVSYLDIGLSRLRAECDVGGFESRIEELWRTAMAITAAEADALLEAGVPGKPCGPTFWLAACPEAILPYPSEEAVLASRAALLAAATSFLATDPRAGDWAESAQSLAARFPASVCQTSEVEVILSQGALSKRLGTSDLPVDFQGVIRGFKTGRSASRCSPFPAGYATAGPVDIVSPGDSLAAAIHDAEFVAFSLSESYLWQFPPGSQCEDDHEEGDAVRVSRF